MTARSALLAGRRRAESLMADRATVSRVTGTTTDPLTGEATPTLEPVYSGRAKVNTYEPYERNPEVAGGTATVQRYFVHVPVGSFRPEIGMHVRIDVAALDPNLTGRTFRVVALLHKTAATAYRLSVEELP